MGNKNSNYNSAQGINLCNKNEKQILEFRTLLLIISKKLIMNKNKRIFELQKKRNEIIELLKIKNNGLLKMKIEFYMRDEDYILVCELISILCEAALEKVSYIFSFINSYRKDKINCSNSVTPPDDLKYILDTIIYASVRFNLEEFNKIREIIKNNYGALYVENACLNAYKSVDEEIIKKLSLYNYEKYVMIEKLSIIANEEKVEASFVDEWFDDSLNFENNGKNENAFIENNNCDNLTV